VPPSPVEGVRIGHVEEDAILRRRAFAVKQSGYVIRVPFTIATAGSGSMRSGATPSVADASQIPLAWRSWLWPLWSGSVGNRFARARAQWRTNQISRSPASARRSSGGWANSGAVSARAVRRRTERRPPASD